MRQNPADQVGRHGSHRCRSNHRHLRWLRNPIHRRYVRDYHLIPATQHQGDHALVRGIVCVIVALLVERPAGRHRLRDDQLQHHDHRRKLPEAFEMAVADHLKWRLHEPQPPLTSLRKA